MEWRGILATYGAAAPSRLGSELDNASSLAPTQGAGAQCAWFDSNVERAVGEVFPAEALCGGAYCEHFGVGRYVGQRFRAVVAASYHASGGHYYGAYGDFAGGGCVAGFGNGKPHEVIVVEKHVSGWIKSADIYFHSFVGGNDCGKFFGSLSDEYGTVGYGFGIMPDYKS